MPGAGGCIVLFLLRPLNAGRRLFPRKRHADGFGTFNFATLVFLLLAWHSPQAVSARAACVGCHQKYRESRDDVAGVLYLFSAKRYPKTPRQMPSPTSSRLTLAPGARLKGGFKGRWAAERIISDTTLSLLKPASYAGARAFSRAFVSRLRHRAGNRSPRNAAGGGAKWPLSQPETPVLNRAQNRAESGPKLPVAMQIPVLNRANARTRGVRPCSRVRVFAGKTDF